MYDISRWGRFQDADESAYLEYICKMAGIRVLYCAEQFENDGSLAATIIKNVKRVMAGEYSRELSIKVFAGQARLVSMGFRQGGTAGLGLRRCLIDQDGNVKFNLEFGQQKSIHTDRIILVPGPLEEQSLVRRIFKMFVEERKRESEIARILNREGIPTDRKTVWSKGKINLLLRNEKYIGNNVFNRVSTKLKGKPKRNSASQFIRSDGAFEAIVDFEVFRSAQSIIALNAQSRSEEDLLETLIPSQRKLSLLTISDLPAECHAPTRSAVRYHFGNTTKAYRRLSLVPNKDFRQSKYSPSLKSILMRELYRVSLAAKKYGSTVYLKPSIGLVIVNDELRIRIVLCKLRDFPGGPIGWRVRFDHSSKTDLTLLVRLCENEIDVHDYYFLPQMDCPRRDAILRESNGTLFDRYRVCSPEQALKLLERVDLRRLE